MILNIRFNKFKGAFAPFFIVDFIKNIFLIKFIVFMKCDENHPILFLNSNLIFAVPVIYKDVLNSSSEIYLI